MSYMTLGYRLPHVLSRVLFGDRKTFGLEIDPQDPCWLQWEEIYNRFYVENQKTGVGDVVNDAGYKVMRAVDLTDKRILEIGPGNLSHVKYWRGNPAHYTLIDVNEEFLANSATVLRQRGASYETHVTQRLKSLPFADASFDGVASFYVLEHLYPLDQTLREIRRVLKPGGWLVGAIPAEGGLDGGSGVS
ncbi:MAG: class I SAM-dependent methyltransferase [Myxococcota bacterium]